MPRQETNVGPVSLGIPFLSVGRMFSACTNSNRACPETHSRPFSFFLCALKLFLFIPSNPEHTLGLSQLSHKSSLWSRNPQHTALTAGVGYA